MIGTFSVYASMTEFVTRPVQNWTCPGPQEKNSLDPPIQVIQDYLEAGPERLSKAEKSSPSSFAI